MFKSCEIEGKRIAYTNDTVFIIQIGKGVKGSYKTHYTIKGNPYQACMLYQGINIGNGFKKRLIVPSFNKPIIARHSS